MIKKSARVCSDFFIVLCFLIPFNTTAFAEITIEDEIKDLLLYYTEDELFVTTASRALKPLARVAENMTVITERDINQMNAHSVAEVLNNVPGLFMSSGNYDFGSLGVFNIQGSDNRHALVLVDDIPWNQLNGSVALTPNIPLGIIKKIEIIKGPASSSWGSSLGGVINIITKKPGNTVEPDGSFQASYGREDSQDHRADISGSTTIFNYYVFAGYQNSDGLVGNRAFDNRTLYSKFSLPLDNFTRIGLDLGYTSPHSIYAHSEEWDEQDRNDMRTFWGRIYLTGTIKFDTEYSIALYRLKQKQVLSADSLGLWFDPSPILLNREKYDETTYGSKAKLSIKKDRHTFVTGIDYEYGKLDQTRFVDARYDTPALIKTSPDITTWAVFVNDTISFDRFTVTPGIRYDNNEFAGSFISPSLGVTFLAEKDTMLRASVSRGFSAPPLSNLSGGSLYLEPNPGLTNEKVWSFQTGFETKSLKRLIVKGSAFFHNVKDAIIIKNTPTGFTNHNGDKLKRYGGELEIRTRPFHDFSFFGSTAFARKKDYNSSETTRSYSYRMGISYEAQNSCSGEMSGRRIIYDKDNIYDDFDMIWNITMTKRIYSYKKMETRVFLSGHNIFNGSQYNDYWGDWSINPDRWFETGLKINF